MGENAPCGISSLTSLKLKYWRPRFNALVAARLTRMGAIGASLAFVVSLAACGTPALQQVTSVVLPSIPDEPCPATSRNPFFAAPMCLEYRLSPSGPVVSAADAEKLGDRVGFTSAALIDSRTKCQNFISRVTGEEAVGNTLLDTTALILTGVASAITGPVTTIRGLAASSTAVQGFKQTANANLFQQLTVALFVQQINTTYFQLLDSEFAPENLSNISAPAALARIQSVHRNCSIPFAAANIASSSQQKPAQSTKTWSVTLSGTPTEGDTIVLTATSTMAGTAIGFPAKVSIPVHRGDNPLLWANELIFQIMNKLALTQSGITANLVLPPRVYTSITFAIQGGPTDIQWAVSSPTDPAATEKVTISSSSGS